MTRAPSPPRAGRTALVVLPGRPSSVPTARHFVESLLTAWGWAESAWTGALVVSELAANAAQHARTEFSVRVEEVGERIRIEVSDGSPRIPRQRTYGVDATTGRGLQLVDQLGHGWGVIPQPGGKTVWVELLAASAVSELDTVLAWKRRRRAAAGGVRRRGPTWPGTTSGG